MAGWRLFFGILLLPWAAGCFNRAGDAMMCGPYLENAGPGGITIRWISDTQSAGVVRWGVAGDRTLERQTTAMASACRYVRDPALSRIPAAEIPADAYAETWFYEARLEGLAPGTPYRYAVVFSGLTREGTFRTFPDRTEPFTFVVFSDTHGDDAVAAAFTAHQPAFLINAGDLVDREYLPEYLKFFSPEMTAAAGRAPMFAARGNHDQSGRLLARLFTFPEGRLYYSFDYANAHVVCLDSCLWRWPDGDEKIKDMLAWCEDDLKRSRAEWKIVFFHEPPYDLSYRRTNWGREDALPIFRRHGVDLIFCGHAHAYQRFVPLFWPGENDRHPITLIVGAGGSGKYLAMPRRADPHLAVRRDENHFMVCRVDGSRFFLQTLTADGREIDALVLAKQDGRLDPAYIAQALPEETFGLIEQSLSRLPLPRREIAPGEIFTITLTLRAGSEPYDFELRPAEEMPGVAESAEPCVGTVPAHSQLDVPVKLRALKAIRPAEHGNRTTPLFALECRYRAGGRTGVISSELARMPRPAP